MANMFSGKSDKQIPKTLNECIRTDSTVSNLHAWAERLERWGETLFVILIVVGVIATIIEAAALVDVNEDMIFPTIVTSIITWGLYAFIEYCAYHVIALLISALASITQHTMISANIALLESSKNNEVEEAPQSSAPKAVLPKNDLPKSQKTCYACGYKQSAKNVACEKCGECLY